MTASELIAELSRFNTSEEVAVEFRVNGNNETVQNGDVDRVEPNNGARRRILIVSNED